MEDKIIESKTDDGEEYLIMGTHPTPHSISGQRGRRKL